MKYKREEVIDEDEEKSSMEAENTKRWEGVEQLTHEGYTVKDGKGGKKKLRMTEWN